MHKTDSPVVAALPGAGWQAVYREHDGTEKSYPVVAWLVHADGTAYACDVDHADLAPVDECGNFVRLVQPETAGQS